LQTVARVDERNVCEVAIGKLLRCNQMDAMRFASEAKSGEIFLLEGRVTADLGDEFRWKGREGCWMIHDGDLLDSFECLLRVEMRVCSMRASIFNKDQDFGKAHTTEQMWRAR
jgi:hypothetical protein